MAKGLSILGSIDWEKIYTEMAKENSQREKELMNLSIFNKILKSEGAGFSAGTSYMEGFKVTKVLGARVSQGMGSSREEVIFRGSFRPINGTKIQKDSQTIEDDIFIFWYGNTFSTRWEPEDVDVGCELLSLFLETKTSDKFYTSLNAY